MTVTEFRLIEKYMMIANSLEFIEAWAVNHESRGKGLV
jgi:hypothetical protein